MVTKGEMSEYLRKLGSKGGKARKKWTAEQRKESARKAAQARWAKVKKRKAVARKAAKVRQAKRRSRNNP